jgi:2-polyprenyl-6-methoxyphenol hydroxylase-like FAD-dependent oxidoreductase
MTRVAIIGGGIGGLTAANALARAGIEVAVYEAAAELKEIGAGVALHPNAMKVLRAIGVEGNVRAVAGQAPWQVMRNWKTGRVIGKTSREQQAASFGITGATVHRADLLDVLAGALPAGLVTLGKRCTGVRPDGDLAVARFAGYRHESWIAECSRREVTERYAGWHESLVRLFAASETWYKWALYDRDPIPRWTRGRVTVLGDAAHPMLPYLGQGACQAIEDDAVLATALSAEASDPVTGLARYERTRRPRASRVVLAARERGLSNHLTSGWAARRRDLLIAWRRRVNRRDPEGRGAAWLADYDASAPDVLTA